MYVKIYLFFLSIPNRKEFFRLFRHFKFLAVPVHSSLVPEHVQKFEKKLRTCYASNHKDFFSLIQILRKFLNPDGKFGFITVSVHFWHACTSWYMCESSWFKIFKRASQWLLRLNYRFEIIHWWRIWCVDIQNYLIGNYYWKLKFFFLVKK